MLLRMKYRDRSCIEIEGEVDKAGGIIEVKRTNDAHEIAISPTELKPESHESFLITLSPRHARNLAKGGRIGFKNSDHRLQSCLSMRELFRVSMDSHRDADSNSNWIGARLK